MMNSVQMRFLPDRQSAAALSTGQYHALTIMTTAPRTETPAGMKISQELTTDAGIWL